MANEKDIKLGTAAKDSAHSNEPDMSRYYYPPGTTEPVLRPEFANEPEPKAAPETKEPSASHTPKQADQDKGK